jgi:hypothetical protein
MHRRRFQLSFECLVAVMLMLCSGVALGQARSGRGGETVLRLRKIEGLGRKGTVRTPQYRTNVSGGVSPIGEWARIRVEYDTYPEWIDELVFQYYALALKTEKRDGSKKLSLYKTTVRYVDIERDREHLSAVYLRPNTIERYGDLVAVAVEITHAGKVVAEASDEDMALPETWWRNPTVLESKSVTVRDGYLLNRNQSPFALINIDDYEAIQ